jgi:hypothetical protein
VQGAGIAGCGQGFGAGSVRTASRLLGKMQAWYGAGAGVAWLDEGKGAGMSECWQRCIEASSARGAEHVLCERFRNVAKAQAQCKQLLTCFANTARHIRMLAAVHRGEQCQGAGGTQLLQGQGTRECGQDAGVVRCRCMWACAGVAWWGAHHLEDRCIDPLRVGIW